MNRDEAFLLLNEYTKSKSLIGHALSVEAAMRHYAGRLGGDVEQWGLTGLLHDFDYEKHPSPEEHPMVGIGILTEKRYPEEMLQAIKAHAPYLGVPRHTMLDKALVACDELTGFIVAVALMRPSKSLSDLKASSVKKKMKQSGFARGVSREDIITGAEELGVSLEEHISFVIEAMKGISDQLGI